LPRKIVELINSFAGGEHYVEPNTDTTKKQRNRLIKLISTVPPSYGLINLTTALTSYQRFSADINGFLRSNYTFIRGSTRKSCKINKNYRFYVDLYNYKHMDLGGTDIDYILYVFRVSI